MTGESPLVTGETPVTDFISLAYTIWRRQLTLRVELLGCLTVWAIFFREMVAYHWTKEKNENQKFQATRWVVFAIVIAIL